MPGQPVVEDYSRAIAMYVRRWQAIPQEERDTIVAEQVTLRAQRLG
jgi:hypothetical protein